MRLITLLLLAILIALQIKLWAGKGGQRELNQLREKVAQQQAENTELKRRNDMLKAEVDGLRAGQASVEERARSELGMIGENEVFYRIVDDAENLPSPPPNPNTP